MEKEQAQSLVEEYLRKSEVEINNFGSALPGYVNPNIKLIILNEITEEHEFGWVFYYNSVKYLNSKNPIDALAGNAPLIINRKSGELIETGTARNTEYYINNYIKTGDPHEEA